MKKISSLKGSFLLLLAAFIWGTTFVAQTSASDSVKTFTFNMSRNIVGSLFLLIFILVTDYLKKKNSTKTDSKWPLLQGAVCGVVLFFAMNMQQFGIGIYPESVATSGRAGFITATYVVMVAIVTTLNKRDRLDWFMVLSVIGTVAGMYFLCLAGGFNGIYLGDLVEFGCAVCFTLHIIVVDKYSKCDGVKLSCIQFAVCALISSVPCFVMEKPVVTEVLNAAKEILYAGILSSGVAYTLQIVGQKYAKPAVASIVMSLESVFAVLAGAIVLKEIMSAREILGCILVFASVILAQVPDIKKSVE